MELITGIKERRSIRRFEDRQIPHDVIEEIIDAARFAPSWKNTQIARYIVVEDRETIAKIATPECTLNFEFNMKTMAKAPAIVLITYVNKRSGYEKDGSFTTPKGDRWEMFDAGIAAQTFCLAAHAKGVGSVIMGIFDENEVAKAVGIPENQTLAAIIPIGYPRQDVEAPARKEVSDLLTFI